MKKNIHTEQAPQPVGCYSQVLLTGNFICFRTARDYAPHRGPGWP